MRLIDPAEVQATIDRLKDQDLYVHIELTTGAYSAFLDSSKHPAAAFLTNAVIRYSHGMISGSGPYRVGLKTERGWVYSEGLTHYDENETERLALAGHDSQGKLIVSLLAGREPFGQERG